MSEGQPAAWCVHYRSMSDHKTCKADVNYDELVTPGVNGRFYMFPCFTRNHHPPTKGLVICEKYTQPAAEEVEKHYAFWDKQFDKITEVFKVLAPIRKQYKRRNGSGEIQCPICGMPLCWSIASNGHMQGVCATKDCISWME